jgi:cytochrome c oxidase subunit 2
MVLVADCGDDESSVGLSEENQALPAAVAAAASLGAAAMWATCATCHGVKGEGSQGMSAPSLVNQNVWYLKRQLQHFRSGLRGAVTGDTQGR